jgi:transposase
MGRREITQSLRDEAVHLVVVEGQSIMQVCALLGIGTTALRRWVAQWRATHEASPSPSHTAPVDRARIAELEATVLRLQEERDLLKKSIAFFVRESDRPKR